CRNAVTTPPLQCRHRQFRKYLPDGTLSLRPIRVPVKQPPLFCRCSNSCPPLSPLREKACAPWCLHLRANLPPRFCRPRGPTQDTSKYTVSLFTAECRSAIRSGRCLNCRP